MNVHAWLNQSSNMWLLYLSCVMTAFTLVFAVDCKLLPVSTSLKYVIRPLSNYDSATKTVTPGTKVIYSCYGGYTFNGTSETTCIKTGILDGAQPPRCTVHLDNCTLPDMTGMILESNQSWSREDGTILAPARVNFTCNKHIGFSQQGSSDNKCAEGGVWSLVPLPTCTMVWCDKPQSEKLIMTRINASQLEPLMVNFSCPAQYALEGPTEGTCNRLAWDFDIPPTCTALFCVLLMNRYTQVKVVPDSDTIINSSDQDYSVRPLAVVTYSCDGEENTVMRGPRVAKCLQNGSFEGGSTICERYCWLPLRERSLKVSVMEDSNRFQEGNRTIFGPCTVEFTCDEGYLMVGVPAIDCGLDGKWNGDVPHCQGAGIRCQIPKQPALVVEIYEQYSKDEFTVESPSKAKFGCEFAYQLIGAQYGDCLVDGQWRPPPPYCAEPGSFEPIRDKNNKVSGLTPTASLVVLMSVALLLTIQLF